MRYKLHCRIVFLCIVVLLMHILAMTCATYSPNTFLRNRDAIQKKRSLPCDSCGNECTSACGTKNFRTCCFNYLRKRNDPTTMKLISSNKHLIDFILLQGRAMYTLNEHKRARHADNSDANDLDDDDDVLSENGGEVDGHELGIGRVIF